MLNVAGPPQQLHKVLVVGDDQQLEVTLAGAALNDSGERERAIADKRLHQIHVVHTVASVCRVKQLLEH